MIAIGFDTHARKAALAAAIVAAVVLLLIPALALGAPPPGGQGGQAGPDGPSFVPGELLVGYEPGVGAERRRAVRGAQGAGLKRGLALPRLELVELPAGEPVRRAARSFEAMPGVAYAEPNFHRELQRLPDDPFFGFLWGLENTGQLVRNTLGEAGADIAAPAAWGITTGSRAVRVAVVDDGIAMTHPDLASNIWRNPGESGAGRETNGIDDDGNGFVDDWRGWDFAEDDNDPSPVGSDADHGTHVGGTIGAQGNNGIGVTGVSWNAGLMPVRVFDPQGRTTISKLISAYSYASDNGARVLNGSFAGGGASTSERRAITQAPETLFVVASGNDGHDNDVLSKYPCGYQLENLLCVAATDQRDRLASFSNYGSQSVHLAAPGVNVLSTTRSGYAYMNGTSMATPHVAGAAALLWAGDPVASVAEVRERLLEGVDSLPSLAGKVASGGRLNAHSSLLLGAEDTGTASAPATTITLAPPARTDRRRARFRFHADEPATFECRFDQRPWRKCQSPRLYRKVSLGRHVFRVRATDLEGNRERPPVLWRWRVTR